MSVDQEIARHYASMGLTARVLEAIAAAGMVEESLDPDVLAPMDEFHIGGRAATVALFDQVTVLPDASLLDIGSGIGGPARFVARAQACRVTGVDLTDEYVELATLLTQRCALADRVEFRHASALALPFELETFDGAYQLHVGMNIADKTALAIEVHRVLRPGSFYAIYDVMATGEDPLTYPVPWASTAETSFVAPPEVYREALVAAGFTVTAERNRAEFALEFFERIRAAAAAGGSANVLGLHLVMGDNFAEKVGNMIANLRAGRIAPVELIARR